MVLTQTMKSSAIPFWEWSRWICYLNNNYPYRVEDFAKSFSENQMSAKSWLVEHLQLHPISAQQNLEIWILGSWYGTILVPLLHKRLNVSRIHLVDYDSETLEIAKGIFKEYSIRTHCIDINFDMPPVEADIIINTSCEHMMPMRDYKFSGLKVFQSNNFYDDLAHINCVDSLDSFIKQSGIQKIDYKGEKQFHRYDEIHKRYMVIGR